MSKPLDAVGKELLALDPAVAGLARLEALEERLLDVGTRDDLLKAD